MENNLIEMILDILLVVEIAEEVQSLLMLFDPIQIRQTLT